MAPRPSARAVATRFASARVARLATVTPAGVPHLVPVVFAVEGDTVWTAVDGKPKSTPDLARLANIAAHPRVAILVDHYDEDWSSLWWVRADGTAQVHPVGTDASQQGIAALAAKYPQYEHSPPPGPVIEIRIESWLGWSAR